MEQRQSVFQISLRDKRPTFCNGTVEPTSVECRQEMTSGLTHHFHPLTGANVHFHLLHLSGYDACDCAAITRLSLVSVCSTSGATTVEWSDQKRDVAGAVEGERDRERECS